MIESFDESFSSYLDFGMRSFDMKRMKKFGGGRTGRDFKEKEYSNEIALNFGSYKKRD